MAVVINGAEHSKEKIKRIISAQEAGFHRAFLAMVKEITEAHTLEEMAVLLSRGQIDEALAILNTAIPTFATQFSTAYTASAQATAAFLSKEALTATVAFDQMNARAVREMTRNKLELIVEMQDEADRAARQSIRHALRRGTAAGQNPIEQARAIRSSIGLTESQQRAVNNYRRYLTEGPGGSPMKSGEALSRKLRDRRYDALVRDAMANETAIPRDKVNHLVDRYYNRYIKYRARVIARTEALRAVHMGSHEMYQQAIDMGQFTEQQVLRTWSSANDGRTRDTHLYLNGQTRGFDEPWETENGPIRFPCDPQAAAAETVQCRCAVLTRILDEHQVQAITDVNY